MKSQFHREHKKKKNVPPEGRVQKEKVEVSDDPIRLVAIGKVLDGTAVLHGKPLPVESVKVSIVECREKDARVPLPTDEVQLVSQALNSFIACPKYLVKPLGYQVISI